MRAESLATYHRGLQDVGLGDFQTALVGLSLPTVALAPPAPNDYPRSHLGGLPRLAEGVSWPAKGGVPLHLIAEIDLAEIAPVAPEGLPLPETGALAFFYDADNQPWGSTPKDHSAFTVLYTPASAASRETQPPASAPEGFTFSHEPVRPAADISLPSWAELDTRSLGMSEEESDAYLGFSDEFAGPPHRMFGHANVVQEPMQAECEQVTQGLRQPDSANSDPSSWLLLAQFASNGDMEWGDSGNLYYWIRADDLAQGAWDRVWVILQCY